MTGQKITRLWQGGQARPVRVDLTMPKRAAISASAQ